VPPYPVLNAAYFAKLRRIHKQIDRDMRRAAASRPHVAAPPSPPNATPPAKPAPPDVRLSAPSAPPTPPATQLEARAKKGGRRVTFFDLPRELRDHVYEHLVVLDRVIEPLHKGKLQTPAEFAELSQVSQPIYDEALELILLRNNLKVTSSSLHDDTVNAGGFVSRVRTAFGYLEADVRHIEFTHRYTRVMADTYRGLTFNIDLDLSVGMTGGRWKVTCTSAALSCCASGVQDMHYVLKKATSRFSGHDGRALFEIMEWITSGAGNEREDLECVKCGKVKLMRSRSG